MEVVRLSYLITREGGWGAVCEWGETLSLGLASAMSFPPSGVHDRMLNMSQRGMSAHGQLNLMAADLCCPQAWTARSTAGCAG